MSADKNAATFEVNMEGNLRTNAESSAAALDKLRSKIEGDQKALRGMEAALRNLKKGNGQNIDQYLELKKRISETSQKLSQNQASFIALGGSFDKASKKGKGTRQELGLLGSIAQKLPGPLGTIAQKLAEFGGDKAALRAMLFKAGLVALTVAVIAAGAALLKLGLAHSDARRSEAIHLEGLTKIRDWYGRVADKGSFLQATIDKVSGSSSLGRGKIAEYTEQLYKMGLRSGNLEQALKGVATVAAVQGEEPANLFAHMAAGVAATRGNVKKLADDVQARLGGLAKAQMLSLSVQAEKLKENLGAMLSGLGIEKFLEGLHSITELLSQNTASGRALKVLFTGLFQPLVDGFAGTAPIAKRFFQGVVISALSIGIAFFRVRNAIRDAFGGPKILTDAQKLEGALLAGKAAAYLLAGAMTFILGKALIAGAGLLWGIASAAWAAVAPLAILAVKALILAAPFLVLAAVFALALAGALALGWGTLKLFQWLSGLDWKGMGKAVIDGLVNGIKSGIKWVREAMQNVGNAMVSAFKNTMGIASPARRMKPDGGHVTGGIAAGVRDNIPEVEAATREVGDSIPGAFGGRNAPLEIATRAPELARSGGSSKPSLSIGELHVHTDATTAKGITVDIKAELLRMLESMAIELGEAVVSS